MTPETLYLATIEDLEAKLDDGSAYAIIRAGGLLRQLLLDGGNSLVDRVNRSHRLKLRFSVQPPLFLLVDNFQVWNPSVRPVAGLRYMGSPPLVLDKDKLLSHKFVSGEGTQFNVKEMIDFCANVAGGVHYGNPRNPEENLLQRMHDESREDLPGRRSQLVFAIRGIVETVVDGLKPLTDAIRANAAARGSNG